MFNKELTNTISQGVDKFVNDLRTKHMLTRRSDMHFFIEKGHAVSAVTIDNAKIFSQLMSKSRSLAKGDERRLQSLLV